MVNLDLTPLEEKLSRETDSETQPNGDALSITQDYLKKMRSLAHGKASTVNRPAIVALGLSVLALFLVGGIFTSIFVYIVVLLATLVPQIRGNQGKKEIASKAARATLTFLPLLIISFIGVYVAPLAGATAIFIGALQFRGKNAAGKKGSISLWAIALSTIAILLSIVVIGVSIIGKSTDPASFSESHPVPTQTPSQQPTFPSLSPPNYIEKEGLTAYKELKQKGYAVKAVFENQSLTERYGDATNFFESLDEGKATAPPAEKLVVGGISQSGQDVKLTIVASAKETTPSTGDEDTIPSAERDGPQFQSPPESEGLSFPRGEV